MQLTAEPKRTEDINDIAVSNKWTAVQPFICLIAQHNIEQYYGWIARGHSTGIAMGVEQAVIQQTELLQ